MSFEREDRYLVLKRSDIEKYLSETDRLELDCMAEDIANGRMDDGRDRDMKCVVVEYDWPEYEAVWKMIEARVDNESKEEPDEQLTLRLRGRNCAAVEVPAEGDYSRLL